MIRSMLLALALCTSFTALGAGIAYGQVTEQTDQSEEDWRKSQKKTDTTDIFEAIKNSRGFGQGTSQGPVNPIDSLPEESRRHLTKERAKVIATTDLGNTPDVPYTPSEQAKADPDLAEQEKAAWEVIMTDLKGAGRQDGAQGPDGPHKVIVAGQGDGQDSDPSGPLRGGSSQSVSDILAQIKGLQGGGSNGSDTANRQSTSESGERESGETISEALGGVTAGTTQTGQDKNSGIANSGQTQSQQTSNASGQDQQQQEVYSQTESADQSAQDTQYPEPTSPLDYIKKQRSSETQGNQTSASDFLKETDF